MLVTYSIFKKSIFKLKLKNYIRNGDQKNGANYACATINMKILEENQRC